MIKIKTEYKGYEIEWQDFRGCFLISKDGIELKSTKDLEEAEKWIKQRDRKKWKRIDVFYQARFGRDNDFSEGIATSIINDNYAWVTRLDKTREKKALSTVFVKNDANKAKIDTIKRLWAELITVRQEVHETLKSMETITPEMMELD